MNKLKNNIYKIVLPLFIVVLSNKFCYGAKVDCSNIINEKRNDQDTRIWVQKKLILDKDIKS